MCAAKTKQTEQRILEAATQVFGQKGFNGATTKEIAQAAGVAEGTIFRYFPTKKDLFISLVSSVVIESLSELIHNGPVADEAQLLRALLQNRAKLMQNNWDVFRLLIYEAQFHPEVKEMFFTDLVSRAQLILEQHIAEQIAAGYYREVNPKIASITFAGMFFLNFLWSNAVAAEGEFSLDQQLDQVVDIFLNGMKK